MSLKRVNPVRLLKTYERMKHQIKYLRRKFNQRHFFQVEDLIKVKQMDRVRLDNVARYLTVDGDDASDQDEGTRPSILTNGYTMPGSHAGLHHRTNGGPPNMPMANGLSMSSAIDIFELLSAYSPRPIIEEVFKYGRDGQPAVRVATWNLHGFSDDKAANFGVKEVVCRTILENGYVG